MSSDLRPVATRTDRRSPGRPRDPAKAAAVLDAAWALFLARGVAAVPIEAIAAAAHVSKGTLYACYPDKTALFKAAVRREMERIELAQGLNRAGPPGHGADQPLRATLLAFGGGIMRFLASAPAVGFYTALAAELRHHPDLAQAFWDLGPGRTRANLAAVLAGAAARGQIMVADPVEAAEALFGLWQGFANMQLALGLHPADIECWIDARVARGVDIFLCAHAVPEIP